MNLKDFFASRENPPELYWSLILEPGWVQAGIWYIDAEAANMVNVGPPAAWETEEEMVSAVDAALSSSIQKLPEDYNEPSKTVFGVPSSWVDGGEIKEEYLAKIKGICSDLSLTPVGFVVLSEAVANLYKSEEGAPLSAIIVGLGADSLEVSVFKMGNLSGSTTVSRSVSLIEDVTEGLSRFEGSGPLPSRFIIYDGKEGELEEAKNNLVRADWEGFEKIKFLHTPKAEILTPERKVLATSLAGANEIGNVTKLTSGEEAKESERSAQVDEVDNVSEPKEAVSAEDFGFSVGKDVSTPSGDKPVVSQEEHSAPKAPEPRREIKIGNYFNKTKSALSGLSFPLSSFNISFLKKNTTLVAGILIIFISILIAAWWFLPVAKVSIVVTPQRFEQEVDVSFDTNGSSDTSAGVIAASEISDQVSGDKTQDTTGQKVVGDKATGSVQIQNGTAFPINLAAGTFITSSGNLKFSLDNSASVSAALSPNSPGNATVSVTADAIGTEYNLAKDELFRVGNYPKAEVDAAAQSDFSGGTSREISAVSKTDQSNLEEALKNELGQKAKEEIAAKVGDSKIFVNDLASVDVSSETFDHSVGDEASNLKLSLTVDAKGVAADRDKFLEFARNVLKDKIPGGYVLKDSQIDYKFTFVGEDGSKLNYKVALGANFLPDVRVSDIVKNISGRSPTVAKNYLTSIPGFVRVEIKLRPSLPGPLGTLPRVYKNISIEVTPE